jgi:uncharacterized surface protein with fasciclin (FAS1) repeats
MHRRIWLAAAAMVVLAGCETMMSQPKNVAETIAADPNLSTLSGLLKQSGLDKTLASAGPFTVFAPTNDAFKKVPAKTMDALAKDPKMLESVLGFHVIPGKVMAADVKQGNVKTVSGANLPLARAGTMVTADSAIVTRPDIVATNGVVHVVDAVLIPPSR